MCINSLKTQYTDISFVKTSNYLELSTFINEKD